MLGLTVLGRAPTTLHCSLEDQAPGVSYYTLYVSEVILTIIPRAHRCINYAKDFIVAGTSTNQLFGTCESLWEPDLEPEELFETVSQALLNSMDRDALAGWGAHVYIITKDQVIKRLLKSIYPLSTPKCSFPYLAATVLTL